VLGDAFGGLASDNRLEEFQELGGGAGEVAALFEEGKDGLDNGVRRGGKIEGQTHFILGASKGGGGGHGPGEGAGDRREGGSNWLTRPRAAPTAEQRAARISGHACWKRAIRLSSVRGARGERVTVRARWARSAGQDQRSVTVRMMGRL